MRGFYLAVLGLLAASFVTTSVAVACEAGETSYYAIALSTWVPGKNPPVLLEGPIQSDSTGLMLQIPSIKNVISMQDDSGNGCGTTDYCGDLADGSCTVDSNYYQARTNFRFWPAVALLVNPKGRPAATFVTFYSRTDKFQVAGKLRSITPLDNDGQGGNPSCLFNAQDGTQRRGFKTLVCAK